MKRTVFILAALLLSGCNLFHKKHDPALPPSVIPGMPVTPAGPAIYPFGGQSNSDYIAQHIGSVFMGGILIPNGVGSTGMSRWMVGGDLYNSMVIAIKGELKKDPGAYVAGLVFWQGETDANAGPAVYGLWPQEFTAMVSDFRRQFGNVPVVFVQITDTGVPGRAELRQLMAGISIPNVAMALTDGITQVGDHTDQAGYEIMAGRIAQAMKGLQLEQ